MEEEEEEEEEEITPVQGCMDRTGQTTSVRTDTVGFLPGRIKQTATITITFPEACQQIITGEDITRRSTITKKVLTTHTRIRGTIRSRILISNQTITTARDWDDVNDRF
jgi:hypothetical protein